MVNRWCGSSPDGVRPARRDNPIPAVPEGAGGSQCITGAPQSDPPGGSGAPERHFPRPARRTGSMLAAVRRSPDDDTLPLQYPTLVEVRKWTFRALRKPLCFYSAREPRLVGYVAGSGQMVDLASGSLQPRSVAPPSGDRRASYSRCLVENRGSMEMHSDGVCQRSS